MKIKLKSNIFRLAPDIDAQFRHRLIEEKITAQSYLEAAVHLLIDKDKTTERTIVRASILHHEKMEHSHA